MSSGFECFFEETLEEKLKRNHLVMIGRSLILGIFVCLFLISSFSEGGVCKKFST